MRFLFKRIINVFICDKCGAILELEVVPHELTCCYCCQTQPTPKIENRYSKTLSEDLAEEKVGVRADIQAALLRLGFSIKEIRSKTTSNMSLSEAVRKLVAGD